MWPVIFSFLFLFFSFLSTKKRTKHPQITAGNILKKVVTTSTERFTKGCFLSGIKLTPLTLWQTLLGHPQQGTCSTCSSWRPLRTHRETPYRPMVIGFARSIITVQGCNNGSHAVHAVGLGLDSLQPRRFTILWFIFAALYFCNWIFGNSVYPMSVDHWKWYFTLLQFHP